MEIIDKIANGSIFQSVNIDLLINKVHRGQQLNLEERNVVSDALLEFKTSEKDPMYTEDEIELIKRLVNSN